ncbi:MAG: hypothetical protein AAB649_05955 [Patescibacteria group bacterium]
MGILSSILFGSGKKRDNPDYQKRVASGGSIVGSLLGSNPRSREWNSQKREILEQFDKKERSIQKQLRREDIDIARGLAKDRGRYQRKMGPEKGEKHYGEHERDEWRAVQRQRERERVQREIEKNEAIRNIQKNINSWKE